MATSTGAAMWMSSPRCGQGLLLGCSHWVCVCGKGVWSAIRMQCRACEGDGCSFCGRGLCTLMPVFARPIFHPLFRTQ